MTAIEPFPQLRAGLLAEQTLELLGAGELRPALQERPCEGGDLVVADERLTQRPALADVGLRVGTQGLDDLVGDDRVVLGDDAQGVTRLEGNSGAFQGELDMARFLVGTAAVQDDVIQDFGLERVLLAPARALAAPIGERDDVARRRGAGAGQLREAVEHRVHPGGGIVIVVDVAVDAIVDALAAHGLQPCVEIAAGLAEVLVAGVTQRQYREPGFAELRRLAGVHELVKALGGIGRVTFAVGADHDHQVGRALEILLAEIRHVHQAHGEAAGFCAFHRELGDAFGVARLAAVEHSDLGQGAGRGCRCRLGDVGGHAVGRYSGEIATQPGHLVAAQRRE